MLSNDNYDKNHILDRRSRKSLQQQLHDFLEEDIRKGLFPLESKLPSLRRIGDLYGVSRETANLAVVKLEEEGYLEVLPGRGAFVVSREAQSDTAGDHGGGVVRSGKNHTIALIIDLGDDPDNTANPIPGDDTIPWAGGDDEINLVYDQLLRSFDREAALRGSHLLSSRVSYRRKESREHLESLSRKVDGIIVLGLINRALYLKLLGLPVPVVSVMANIETDEMDDVGIDNRKSWRNTARWLTFTGHKGLLYVDGREGYFQGQERYQGCLEGGEAVAFLCAGGWGAEDSRKAFLSHIRSMEKTAESEGGGGNGSGDGITKPIPQAVLAVNDITAMGVLQACRELGLRVPEDISIVGGKNSVVGLNTDPPLTTVDCHFDEMARTAVERLYQRIGGGVRRAVKMEIIGSVLERGSTRRRDHGLQ